MSVISCGDGATCQAIAVAQRELVIQFIDVSLYLIVLSLVIAHLWQWRVSRNA